MRLLFGLFISLVLAFCTSYVALAQELSTVDREGLRRAERTADRFVERFRQTLDFATVWKEFKVSDANCNYRLNGPWNREHYERLRLSDAVIERLYIAFMNDFYLSMVYRLGVMRIVEDSDYDQAVEKLLPEQIRAAEKKLEDIEVGDWGNPRPRNAKEVGAVIEELRSLSRIWRKHLPRDVMRSPIWRANIKYLLSRDDGISNSGVRRGHAGFCIPGDTKYYIVDRGLFYFYFVEEEGRMKVAGFGIGN